jgi:hypothetical protein
VHTAEGNTQATRTKDSLDAHNSGERTNLHNTLCNKVSSTPASQQSRERDCQSQHRTGDVYPDRQSDTATHGLPADTNRSKHLTPSPQTNLRTDQSGGRHPPCTSANRPTHAQEPQEPPRLHSKNEVEGHHRVCLFTREMPLKLTHSGACNSTSQRHVLLFRRTDP